MFKPFSRIQDTFRSTRMGQTIWVACALTLLTLGLGSAFALYSNWKVRVDTSKEHLVRSAEMVNMLIENALLISSNSLSSTKHDIEKQLLKGDISKNQAYVLLMQSKQGFNEYNHSELLGRMFWTDKQGILIAKTGEYSHQSADYSNEFFFQDLINHPGKRKTIGRMIRAKTNEQWVFHMSVPIYDARGEFAGVLAQELIDKSLSEELIKYIDTKDFSQIMSHYKDGSVSFVYPMPSSDIQAHDSMPKKWLSQLTEFNEPHGNVTWNQTQTGSLNTVLVGFSQSPIHGLVSFATMPMHRLIELFIWENLNLLLYILAGTAFILIIFYQLHKMSVYLVLAQDNALHDPLTRLHNRRAFDEHFMPLLRSAMRTQEPISVLFIDIDFFRRFNQVHGHETGDVALVAVARTLVACCKRPLDFVCRWGGEEFVALLPRTNQFAAEKVANDMLIAMRHIKLKLSPDRASHITVSIGIVTAMVSRTNQKNDWIGMADNAMRFAKSHGRDQYVVFHPELTGNTEHHLRQAEIA